MKEKKNLSWKKKKKPKRKISSYIRQSPLGYQWISQNKSYRPGECKIMRSNC